MTTSQRLELRRSEIRTRLAEIAKLEGDAFTNELRSEAESLQTEYGDTETRLRAALVSEESEEREAAATFGDMDVETRERVELRSRASLGAYLARAVKGRAVDGAEAELMEAAGIEDGIPLELWDTAQPEQRTEERSVTGTPGTVGVNLDTIRPAVFAPSIAPRLGIEMPRVNVGDVRQRDDRDLDGGGGEGEE